MSAPVPLLPEHEPPHAEITRTGRWTYSITIIHGLIAQDCPWGAFGRSRAEKRARRILARYVRQYGTSAEKWTIR